MQKFRILILIIILIIKTQSVSLNNIVQFFNSTFDINYDGHANLQQFTEYYNLMVQVTQEDIIGTFKELDVNGDWKVTLEELIKVSGVQIDNLKAGHKQIHIGLTGKSDQMQVIWVSNPQAYNMPIVYYGQYPGKKLKEFAFAQTTTYNVGHIGFHGKIYRAVMKGLIPRKKYYYKVGDLQTQTFSEIKYFNAAPQLGITLPEINFAIFGDMGTFAPNGHQVIKQITSDNFVKPYNFVFLTGDIAYAGMNSQKVGELEPIWDIFGQLAQKFTAYIPFMPGVGNHQAYYNFSSYFHRYVLPRNHQNQTNLWFSFDYGQLHICYFSSQHPYSEGSQQYKFIENDLKQARQNENTKWIILGAHRPFYSSSKRQKNPTNLIVNLEQLINTYKVDIVQTGHQHSYQRTWPVYKNVAFKLGQQQNRFVKPLAPIYVVQGTSGALIRNNWKDEIPVWSLKRILRYGYGRITIKGDILRYQFISTPGGQIIDQWSIEK